MTPPTPNIITCTWGELRQLAEAADQQMTTGPREWPGQPSRQRLELFLAASPRAVLALLDERDALAAKVAAWKSKVRRYRRGRRWPVDDEVALGLW